MDWTLSQSFLAVANSGSLSTAARLLDASQPTISRHIQALEKQLGYKVFLRHSRGVKLTDRGGGLGLRREDFKLRTDSLALHFEALLAGVGIVGTHVALARRHPELVQVLHDVRLPALEMWVVVHEELRRERGISLVFEALAEFLSEYAAQ